VKARLSTLQEIEAALWQELAGAVRDKLHGWRTPVLATVATRGDGVAADARTVVLREVNVATRELLFYSDARAPKAGQLREQPHATLVMWCAALGWQLRCRVRLSLQEEGLAVSSRWATLKHSAAAQDYLAPLAPGSPLAAATSTADQRENFAVITAAVDEVDWLELHPQGHRRARFSAGMAEWLQP
jgi:pyridoxine/pyridoxamine 5'-phosphate oxidase